MQGKIQKLQASRKNPGLDFQVGNAPAFSRLDSLAQWQGKRNYKPGMKVVITSSLLRLEYPLTGSYGSLAFQIANGTPVTGQTTQRSTEVRLKINDSFRATSFGFYIGKLATTTTAPGLITKDTWPNSKVYTGATESDRLMELYNGNLTIQENQSNVFPSLPIYDCYRVPTSQKGVAVSTAGAGTLGSNGWGDSPAWAYTPLTPSFLFNGANSYTINLNLPESTDLSSGGATLNVAILEFRGLLIQNGALYNAK